MLLTRWQQMSLFQQRDSIVWRQGVWESLQKGRFPRSDLPFSTSCLHLGIFRYTKDILSRNNSVALVRDRTIPTERPRLLGEVRANVWWQKVLGGQRNGLSHQIECTHHPNLLDESRRPWSSSLRKSFQSLMPSCIFGRNVLAQYSILRRVFSCKNETQREVNHCACTLSHHEGLVLRAPVHGVQGPWGDLKARANCEFEHSPVWRKYGS
jgi:hypothetical protein